MKNLALMVVAVALVASVAFAGGKTYQFTGKVLDRGLIPACGARLS